MKKQKYYKELGTAVDASFTGALALENTRLLSDRSMGTMTGLVQTNVGIGIAGTTAKIAQDMMKKSYKRRK